MDAFDVKRAHFLNLDPTAMDDGLSIRTVVPKLNMSIKNMQSNSTTNWLDLRGLGDAVK